MPNRPESAPDKGPTEWGEGTHGVGPWALEHPDLPIPDPAEDLRYDRELLAGGDRRNVVDRYRYWTLAAINADLDARRAQRREARPIDGAVRELHIAIENFENDANIGTVVRTANAFLAETVHIVGRRRWNRRGAMVTDRYQHIVHHDTVADLMEWCRHRDLPVVAIDNVPGSVPLETAHRPSRCLLLFGQEGPGVTEAAQHAAVMTCSIAQFGSTRSINVGVAAGIAMHTWIRQWEG